MSSSLLVQQCSDCPVRLIWMDLEMGGMYPYNCCFVGWDVASRICSKQFVTFLCSPRQTFFFTHPVSFAVIIIIIIIMSTAYIYIYIYIYMCVCVCVCVCYGCTQKYLYTYTQIYMYREGSSFDWFLCLMACQLSSVI